MTGVKGHLEDYANKNESDESECDAPKMTEAVDVLDDNTNYELDDSKSFEEDEKTFREEQKNGFGNIDTIETNFKSFDDNEQLCNRSGDTLGEIVTDVEVNHEVCSDKKELIESGCGASKMADSADVLHDDDEFFESNDNRSFELYEEQKNECENTDAVEAGSENFDDKEHDGSSIMLSEMVTDVESNLEDCSSKNEFAESVYDSSLKDHDSLQCFQDMRDLPFEENTTFENSSLSGDLTTNFKDQDTLRCDSATVSITHEVACEEKSIPIGSDKMQNELCDVLLTSDTDLYAGCLKETDLVDNKNAIESENTCITSSSFENSTINELNDNEVHSKNAEEEKTNLSSGHSVESDKFETPNVFNSSEDALGENNRGIEDSYQLSGSVQVKVSYLAISDGSVIFAVQPLHLQEEFLLLKQSMQEFYSKNATSYDLSSQENYCIVYHENEWYRGKILGEIIRDTSTVLLIDYGDCVPVDNSQIKNLDVEHSNVPPFAVWCTLSSVICPLEKSETAKSFLKDKLKNDDTVVKILDAGEPYKINLYVDGDSILNPLLKNSLVTQKLPNMFLESGPYKAKLSFLNIQTVEIFVRLVSFCDEYNALFESMQDAYKLEDFVSNVVESGMYAAFYNGFWYRGLIVSSGNEVQVYLVDVGETITECKNLCFLLPEHCFQPAFAIPCQIPFSDIQATNEIFESINSILKAADFLVNINVCPDSNSISATLIDEQIVSEVKNIGLTCATEYLESIKRDSIETEMPPSNDAKLSFVDASVTAVQVVPYVEETFTTEPS